MMLRSTARLQPQTHSCPTSCLFSDYARIKCIDGISLDTSKDSEYYPEDVQTEGTRECSAGCYRRTEFLMGFFHAGESSFYFGEVSSH